MVPCSTAFQYLTELPADQRFVYEQDDVDWEEQHAREEAGYAIFPFFNPDIDPEYVGIRVGTLKPAAMKRLLEAWLVYTRVKSEGDASK